jgi:Zn-dependent peptidase ImmA (M78 family)/transcriptional regulator with XRE-family HTH domain
MNADADLAAAHALFEGGQLTLAREYARLRKVDLARMLDVTPAAITQYEQGKTRPGRATLAALALQLGVPPIFFVPSGRPNTVSEASTHFRSLRSTTRMTRLHLLARLRLLAQLIELVDEHVALPPVDVPRLDVAPGRMSAAKAAREVRERWGLGNGPITHTVRMLEAHGVIVTRPRVDSSAVDAFSCWLADRPVVVLASDKDDGARSRFDGPHELGHLVMHHEAEPGDPDHERDAHAFAAEFLMPATAIRPELPTRLSWARYIELKARWGASISALLRRARDLEVITHYAYDRAMVQLSKKGWRIHEPAPVPVEDPTLLQRALVLMADAAGLDDRVVATQLRLHPDQVAELLSDVTLPRRPLLSMPDGETPTE